MNKTEFEKIFESRVSKTRDLLITKASHYASDSDRMHNFKRAGNIKHIHPCDALDGMLLKHLTSYYDILGKINNGERIPQETIDEKLGDIITYFFLQEALMYDTDSVNMVADAEYEPETPIKDEYDPKKIYIYTIQERHELGGKFYVIGEFNGLAVSFDDEKESIAISKMKGFLSTNNIRSNTVHWEQTRYN